MDEDLCITILSRFSGSNDEKHQHLCAVIGAMSQEFKDQSLPSTPVAYFGATCSSLDRLSSEPDPPTHSIDALVTILSLIITRLPVSILKKKREFVSELVVRILRSSSTMESSVISGLKCLSHLLIKRDTVNWSDVSLLYGVLLGFITDSRQKVRRQSHLYLRDSLLSFQGSSLLASASEGITNIFERFLLLAGGANVNTGEGPKGAQQVLYILDALKDCLPLMSTKYTTSILKYFKTLLDLCQPLVTRRITDGLNLLCIHPTSEVSPEALLELLSSLAISISTNETSGDGMTFTARLLDAGVKKVYSLNRQICVVKLPVVFNALKDILASEHEEATYAATDAFKSLINFCVDEILIKQGVDQITMYSNTEARRSGPTIIEKVCVTVGSLLEYHYTAVWDRAFQVVSVMFRKLGNYSTYLLRGTLKDLAEMQKLPDEDFPFRKQLNECLGSALVAMGPETFLSLLPLNLEAEDFSEANVWLFPILKQYIVCANISFFTDSILGMIHLVRQRSRQLEAQGRILSSRSVNALAYSLWSLLPSFCNYPLDTAESFTDLAKTLCSVIHEEPDIRGIICSSIQILIQQNKKVMEDKADKSCIEEDTLTERVIVHYTREVATKNLHVFRSSARDLLSTLSGVFLKSTKDDGGCLQSTIRDIASISDKDVVSRLFKSTMQKLLKVTQEAGKVENTRNSNSMQIDNSSNNMSPSLVRAHLIDLAVSLMPGLNAKEIDLLFIAIKPALQDVEGVIQKKAYKVLSILLKDSEGFLPSKLEEVLRLMVEMLPSCQFSAKRHRLDCLYFLIIHASKDDLEQSWHDIVASFLTEIVLALKEANKKTRNRSYEILVQIGHACGDEERGGKRENLYQFFNMVAGGLAGETPHMISAAVKGLARLAYEFSDLVSTAWTLLPSTFLLLKRKNREIIKANLGLLKVLVAKSQAEGLKMHLRIVVEGLLNWQDNTKNHFKAKVKLLLEMLVRKCGLEAVKAVVPEEHMKLLTNIRKIKERKERKQGAKSEETRSYLSKATTSRQSRWNHTKIFSDFDDEESEGSDAEYDVRTVSDIQGKTSSLLKSRASSLRSKKNKNLPENLFDQSEDEPLDLLDRQKTRAALRSSEHLKRKSMLDVEPEIDPDGRLIIREEEEQRKERPSDPDSDTRSQTSHLSVKSGTKTQKRRKTLDSGWAYTGNEYASKKATGDVKRKDKLEPYAYWPLDRKMMSRRPEHRAAARKGMSSVVKMTKKLEGKSASSLLSIKGLKLKKTQKKGSKRKNK
ncbi:RRP12-like protein [Quillaja saponaria]|uniref:RRP12-like protein n=1 Tax=Quillaja saponaria TaxID=32244 RepID=A0AAD7QDF6_QUISA|nr:RRP12-like protein [Quillaja saponaria]